MNWIKIDSETATKPEVLRIAEIMGCDRFSAFGRCIVFWLWADGATHDGYLPWCSASTINAIVCDGFAEAMQSVGWLAFDGRGAAIPNFNLHNGNSAKKRAMTNRRVAEYRERQQKRM